MKIKKRDLLALVESYLKEQALDFKLSTSDKRPSSESEIKTAINDLAYFYDRAKELKELLSNQISSLESKFGDIQSMTLENVMPIKSILSSLPGTESMISKIDAALDFMKKIDTAISDLEDLFASPIDSKKWAEETVKKYMVDPSKFTNQPAASKALNSARALGELLGLVVDSFKGMIKIFDMSKIHNPNTDTEEFNALKFLFNVLILFPKAIFDVDMQSQFLDENISFLKETFPNARNIQTLVQFMEKLLEANQSLESLGNSLTSISLTSARDAKTQERFNDDYEAGF